MTLTLMTCFEIQQQRLTIVPQGTETKFKIPLLQQKTGRAGPDKAVSYICIYVSSLRKLILNCREKGARTI